MLKAFRLRRPPLSPAGATSLRLDTADAAHPSPASPGDAWLLVVARPPIAMVKGGALVAPAGDRGGRRRRKVFLQGDSATIAPGGQVAPPLYMGGLDAPAPGGGQPNAGHHYSAHAEPRQLRLLRPGDLG